ncbi:MAG: hypothetical protein D6757_10205 [Alphaproteobacteria bacterium]|nr:MAG: hypothetical protein D6757_10205 [Alphaproteobacteria bacterium]
MLHDIKTRAVSLAALLVSTATFVLPADSRADDARSLSLQSGGEPVHIVSSCPPDPGWFPHAQTPPANDAGFKGGSACDFHKWAWQTFLWLTQDDGSGQPRFLSFPSPQDLGKPVGMEKSIPLFLPRTIKSKTGSPVDEIAQAGSGGLLIDRQGRAVYYSQHIDPTYVDFIRSNQLTSRNAIDAFSPTTPFPVGTKELKISWKIATPEEAASGRFFTIRAQIAALRHDANGKIVADPTRPIAETLALVGFHVVGTVAGHPEMIWATFEHEDNAPDLTVNEPTPEMIVSRRDWTFYQAYTPYSECNVNAGKKLMLNETTQKLSPITQACQLHPFGVDPQPASPMEAGNRRAIVDLDRGVRARLSREGGVWSHYFESGAIWFKDGSQLKPGLGLADDTLLAGSLKLANTTMETFTQEAADTQNCFRCHNTLSFQGGPPNMDLDISHAFIGYFFSLGEKNDAKK